MKIEGYDFEGKEYNFGSLVRIMEKHGFVHAEQWDYERVSLDYKMLDTTQNATYYLRVLAYAVDGEIPKRSTKVRLLTPILGRHYYPHGVEYDEDFPDKIVKKSTAIIEKAAKDLFASEKVTS
ncbi:YugN family protein [Bacillus piscicola]|uniref:YugN family protein n=1 Tax=Bacillus piscicola TaxID=1632684 RepID=UPI001F0A0132|nr:YugN family protein [Bacillus piscicola]